MKSDPKKRDWPYREEVRDEEGLGDVSSEWSRMLMLGGTCVLFLLIVAGVIIYFSIATTPLPPSSVPSAPAKPISPEVIQLVLVLGCFVGIWILVALNAAILWILLRRRPAQQYTINEKNPPKADA